MSYPTLRVRALIIKEGYVMLGRLQRRPVSFLPGGRVESGESLTDALLREVQEECGAITQRLEYLGAVENKWIENNRLIHDLSHFFLVESKSLCPSHTPRCKDAGVELYWVDSDKVHLEPIKPEPVKMLVCDWLDGARDPWWAYEQEA